MVQCSTATGGHKIDNGGNDDNDDNDDGCSGCSVHRHGGRADGARAGERGERSAADAFRPLCRLSADRALPPLRHLRRYTLLVTEQSKAGLRCSCIDAA
eukprot:COSAG04_NODE_22541_length_353_cov_0.779528_1_plen_98_part_01